MKRNFFQSLALILLISCAFWLMSPSEVHAQNTVQSIPDPVTLNYTNRLMRYSNVSLNGQGNTITLSPGENINLKFDWVGEKEGDYTYCPGCFVQFYTGLQGAFSRCLTSSFYPGAKDHVEVSFTAPSEPGIHYITQNHSLQFNCVDVGFNNNPDRAIGSVVVSSPNYQEVAPAIKKLSASTSLRIPLGLKKTCVQGTDTLSLSSTCPVVEANGYTYWALSYIDNRVGMAIVAYDEEGRVVDILEKTGARYVSQIKLDAANQTVAFIGQSDANITLSWNDLVLPQSHSGNSSRFILWPTNRGNQAAWTDGQQSYEPTVVFGTGSNQLLDEDVEHTAGKQFCEARQQHWFNFVSGTDASPYMSLTCIKPPLPGQLTYNANINRLLDAAVNDHSLMKALEQATTEEQLISVAKTKGFTITAADIEQSKGGVVVQDKSAKRTFRTLSASSCGNIGQSPCGRCLTRQCVYFPFSFCCIQEGRCACIKQSSSTCKSGLKINENGICVSPIPTPTITVSDLPSTIDLPGTSTPLQNIVGKKAVVTHADYANYFVPNGKNQSVNCSRLSNYKALECRNGDISCNRLTSLEKSCSSSTPKCSEVNIKDNNNHSLPFALYTLEEWNTIYPGGLKVNANWFDIDGPPNFPYISPCTQVYGYSANNGTEISSASKGDPVGSQTNLLDALIITSHSLPDGTTHKNIKVVANSDIASTNNISQAVSGFIILKNGRSVSSSRLPSSIKSQNTGARTGVGIKNEGDGSQTLILVVVQPGSRQPGMTAKELALYLKQLGATDVINLDNSGSSQLLYNSSSGLVITKKGDLDQNNKPAYRPIPNFLQISIP